MAHTGRVTTADNRVNTRRSAVRRAARSRQDQRDQRDRSWVREYAGRRADTADATR